MKLLITQHRNVGFLSDFNLIVTGLLHLYHNSITEFNIQWNNWRYQSDNSNLFDTFFMKSPVFSHFDKIVTIENIEEVKMWKPIMEKKEIELLHNILKMFNYFNNNIYKQSLNTALQKVGNNFLGVHVRGTDAAVHRPALSLDAYFEAIDAFLLKSSYKGIFVATDEDLIIKKCIARYGQDFIHFNHDCIRSKDGNPLHYNPNFGYKSKLASDVLLDGVCLSLCNGLVHTASNVAGYSLMLNPHMERNQIDVHIPHY